MAKLKGVQKASILLLCLDEDTAAQVLRNLEDEEIRKITQTISRLPIIKTEQLREVLLEAKEKLRAIALVGRGEKFVHQLLKKALGEKRLEEFTQTIQSLTSSGEREGIFDAKHLDSRMLATLIQDEHPQIIALILSLLPADKAKETLLQLPENIRADIIYRMSTIENIPPEVIEQIQETFRDKLSSISTMETGKKGGLPKVLEIVKKLDRHTVENILADLEEIDPNLTKQIESKMFTFDDLIGMDDRGVQTLLREIDTRDLVLALKAASEELKDLFLRNMSKRAREMIIDDMEAMGPVRLKDVEAAQQRIVDVAKRLEEEGKIILQKGGEENVLV